MDPFQKKKNKRKEKEKENCSKHRNSRWKTCIYYVKIPWKRLRLLKKYENHELSNKKWDILKRKESFTTIYTY